MAKKHENQQAEEFLQRYITICHKNFNDSPQAQGFLRTLGIYDTSLMSKYQTGYANGRLNEILPEKSDIRTHLKRIGLLTKNDGEYFNGCIIFPIYDEENRLVNIYGLFIDESTNKIWKGDIKKNLFLPNRPKGLWNVSVSKIYPEIILVKTIPDALSLIKADFQNTIATFEGDGFEDRHRKHFEENGVNKIMCLPDEFNANRILVEQGMEVLKEAVASSLNPVMAPKTESNLPALKEQGFITVYGSRRYHIMKILKDGHKLKITLRIEHAGRLHIDTLDLYQSRARKLLSRDLARVFNESPEIINADLSRLIQDCEKHQPAEEEKNFTIIEIKGEDKKEAEKFGRSSDLLKAVTQDSVKCGFIGEEANVKLGYIAMTSRKMERPLNLLSLSSPGAGKSALQDSILSFCNPEDYVKLTHASGKALFYMEQNALKHKALSFEESEGAEQAIYAIRNLITSGVLIIESTIKDLSNGRLVTMENKVNGPTAVFITTTNPRIDPETKSRFFLTSINESREQTIAIQKFQRQQHTLKGLSASLEAEAIRKKHHNFQRMIKPMAVINPFAPFLEYGDDTLAGRRDQPKYLHLINAVAFTSQMRKEIKQASAGEHTIDYIEVSLEDIQTANTLAQEILGRSLDELSSPGRELLMQIEEMIEKRAKVQEVKTTDITFSRKDIRDFTGWKDFRVHTHIKELVNFEYVSIDSGRNGCGFRYRLSYQGQGKHGEKFLLGLKPVEQLAQLAGI